MEIDESVNFKGKAAKYYLIDREKLKKYLEDLKEKFNTEFDDMIQNLDKEEMGD